MRILHFTSSDGKFGSAKCLIELLKYEIISGDNPIVVTPKHNQINEFCAKNHIENHVIDYQQYMIPKHNVLPIFCIKYVVRLIEYYLKINNAIRIVEKTIDLNSIDVIHTNVSVVSIGAMLAKRNNIPHVWHIREYGKEDFHFVSVIPNTISFMNRHVSVFIAISDAVKETWIKRGISRNHIVTCYDGVEEIPCIKEMKQNEQRIRLVMTGAISETKGQKRLIEAIDCLPVKIKGSIELDIYGTGQEIYVKKLKELIDKKKLKNVNLKGYEENIRQLLPMYDIGIICSKSEGFGRVTVEYMLSKLLVVASNSGANKELLDNGECGILFEPESNDSFVKALVEAIETCKSSLKIQKAYTYARENFVIKNNIQRIRKVFFRAIIESEKG